MGRLDWLQIINKMSNNKDKNIKLIKNNIKQDDYDIDLFRTIMDKRTIEEKRVLAIEAYLECGAKPKKKNYSYDDDIISEVIYCKYKEENIIKIINLVIKYGYNLNDISYKKHPIIYSLISNYDNNITPIYKALVNNVYDIFMLNGGFDSIEKHSLENHAKIKDYDLFVSVYKEDRKRLYNVKYQELINNINNNYPSLDFRGGSRVSLLHMVVSEYYDEDIILDVIKYLLEKGLNPNIMDIYEQNFIYYALNLYHTTDFICKLINLSLDYGLDINCRNVNGNTIMHHLIKKGIRRNIVPIFEILLNNNFDCKITNKNGESVLYLMLNKSDIVDREEFIKKYSYLYDKKEYVKDEKLVDLGQIKYYKKFSDHNYLSDPFYTYASNKFNIILGNDCSLKSTTLNNFSDYYVFKNGYEKAFITSSDILIKNCLTISGIREKLVMLFEKCIENNYALFIDDFDKLYNFNNSIYDKKQLVIILGHYINNEKLKLTITINSKNKDFASSPILKDSINYLELKDLTDDKLLLFLDDYLVSKEEKNNIKINENIINILKQLLLIISKENNIKDKENITNVKIVIEIINKIIEYKNDIDISNLIYSIKINEYIKDEIKDIIANELNNNYSEENVNILIKKLTK